VIRWLAKVTVFILVVSFLSESDGFLFVDLYAGRLL